MGAGTLLLILLGVLALLITILVYKVNKDNPVYQLFKEVRKDFRKNKQPWVKNIDSTFAFHGKYAYTLTLSSGKIITVDLYVVDSGSKLMRHYNGMDTNNDYHIYVGKRYPRTELTTDRLMYNDTAKKLYEFIKQRYKWQANDNSN